MKPRTIWRASSGTDVIRRLIPMRNIKLMKLDRLSAVKNGESCGGAGNCGVFILFPLGKGVFFWLVAPADCLSNGEGVVVSLFAAFWAKVSFFINSWEPVVCAFFLGVVVFCFVGRDGQVLVVFVKMVGLITVSSCDTGFFVVIGEF